MNKMDKHPERTQLRKWPDLFCSALFSLVFVCGCATPQISPYDAVSYKEATACKVDALALIQKAADLPAPHQSEIDAMKSRLQKDIEYENGKGASNQKTIDQWKLLADPNGHLVGGFLVRWITDNKSESPAFIAATTTNVSRTFDAIIQLENQKIKQ